MRPTEERKKRRKKLLHIAGLVVGHFTWTPPLTFLFFTVPEVVDNDDDHERRRQWFPHDKSGATTGATFLSAALELIIASLPA